MTSITTRAKIRAYVSTDPAAMGYGNAAQRERAIQAMMARPDFIGTVRTVNEYIDGLKRRFGGADYRIELRLARDGAKITRDELLVAMYLYA